MVTALRPLFGQDPLFKTKRVTVYSANNAETNSTTPTQLFYLGSAVNGIIWESGKKDTTDEAKPTREVAGLRLELGGNKNYSAKDVKAEKRGIVSQFLVSSLEAIWLFLRKIFHVAQNVGLGQVVNDLTGKTTTAPVSPAPSS
jgi:hypothetical protein